MKVLLCMIGLAWSLCSFGQKQELRPDSAASPASDVQDSIRVRSHGMTAVVDSLWADSIWTWSGPCDGPSRTFRFELGDTVFCSLDLPCVPPPVVQPSGLNAPLTTDAAVETGWTVETTVPLDSVLRRPRKPIGAECYPPATQKDFELVLAAMDAALFESDKCRTLIESDQQTCLTRAQMKRALQGIPSEDRRLETLAKITSPGSHWTEAELRELFQLNFILEQALKRFAKR